MEKETLLKEFEKEKWTKLALSIGIDLIGNLTYIVPAIGEWADLVLAPLTAMAIYYVHNKTVVGAGIGFLEEIIPFTDIIPTATLIWFKRYIISKDETLAEFVQQKKKEKQILNS